MPSSQKNKLIDKHKTILRTGSLIMRSAISPEQRQISSEAICEKIQALSSFKLADSVLLYSAFRGEIDVSTLFDMAHTHGKKVYFPRCDGNDMHFHRVTSLKQLTAGTYGILEPNPGAERYDPDQSAYSSVCIIPGLVYDWFGFRLGHGKGFYDRFLSQYHGTKIGVTYDSLVIDRVPKRSFDIPVDVVVSEKKLYLMNK